MNRNLKFLVGAVLVLMAVAVMGQTQGDLALARTRTQPTRTNSGSSATGIPSSGSNGTGSNGTGTTSTQTAGNVAPTSVTGAAATGVPGNGQNAGPGATSIGQPGYGQSVTKVATAKVIVAPTLTPRPPQPSPTRSIKITFGGSSYGAPGATGVPG